MNRTSTVPVEFHRDEAHAQTVETRPFSPPLLGLGNEATVHPNVSTCSMAVYAQYVCEVRINTLCAQALYMYVYKEYV